MWHFMTDLGKPQLHAKFGVARFSRCRNILKGNWKIWEILLANGHAHFIFWVRVYDGPWQTPAACHIRGC